jgi:recombination protein RecA
MENKTLKETLKDLNKDYGDESISFADSCDRGDIKVEPTNCYSIDQVMGVGGLPKGRIIEIFGAPSGGKSTMAMYFMAQMQKKGMNVAYIDAEFSFSSVYARSLGVDTKKMLLSQPMNGEEALDTVERLVRTREVGFIIVDSTAALVPEKEIISNVADPTVAMQARLLSKGLRKITGELSKAKTILVFISQLRDKIGFSGFSNGPTTESTGGKAIKFYSSVRLKVEKIKALKKGDVNIGNRLRITGAKNKVGFPNRMAEVDLYFEKGIDVMGDIFDVACSEGIIARLGTTYSYAGEKIAVGREKCIEELENRKELYEKIKEQVYLIGQDKNEKDKIKKDKR